MNSLVSIIALCHMLLQENSDAQCTFINFEKYGTFEKLRIEFNSEINIQISTIDGKLSATASHFDSEMVFASDLSGKVLLITK